jgi:hypothetical protein
MSNKPPAVEYAATDQRDGATAYRSLAGRTGLPIARIEELAARNELSVLFAPTGRLRPAAECRSLEAAGRLHAHPSPTPQQRLVELYRHPPWGGVDGSD